MAKTWGYLRHYTRWNGSPGLSLREQKDLTIQLLHDLGYRPVRPRYRIEEADGKENGNGWPAFRNMVEEYKLEASDDDVIVIPTLDGVQFNRSFLTRVMASASNEVPICVRSGWRRVGTLYEGSNHETRSSEDIWKLAALEYMTAFERMVKALRRRTLALSETIKKGLKAAARRGVLLGGQREARHRFTMEERSAGGRSTASARTSAARQHYENWLPQILQKNDKGWSMERIARFLNVQGASRPDGRQFTRLLVWRILQRERADGAGSLP